MHWWYFFLENVSEIKIRSKYAVKILFDQNLFEKFFNKPTICQAVSERAEVFKIWNIIPLYINNAQTLKILVQCLT